MPERVKKRLTRQYLYLGKAGPTFNSYRVRFRVKRKVPTVSELCRSSVQCLRSREDGQRCSGACFLGSGVLFALQVVVLTLGVVDLCLNARLWNTSVHLTLTTIAVVLTTVQMALRIVAIQTYRIQTVASDLSISADGNDLSIELNRIHSTSRKVLTFIGMCFILLNVVLFPLFYVFLHLGWTHLTNNLLIACFGRAHDVFQSALHQQTSLSNEDSHKAVLFEAAQLLQEQFYLRSLEGRFAYQDQANKFLMALKNTPCYVKPDYINLDDVRPRSLASSSSQTEDECATPEEHLSCI